MTYQYIEVALGDYEEIERLGQCGWRIVSVFMRSGVTPYAFMEYTKNQVRIHPNKN